MSRPAAEAEPEALDRWLGSKRWLARLYPERLPSPSPRGRFFDAFTGSGTIALHFLKTGRRVVMCDTNPRLIGAYRWSAQGPDQLVRELKGQAQAHRAAIAQGPAAAKAHFGELRCQLNQAEPDAVESAALFLLMLRIAFNGLYRVNQKGGFNATYGKPSAKKDLVDEAKLRALGHLLRRAELRCADFEQATTDARRGDAVYFDPPYVAERGRAAFVSYAAGGFTASDRLRLGCHLRTLDAAGVRWTLSDAKTAGAASTYGLWRVTEVSVRRSVAARAESRGDARELLVSNW